MSRSSGAVTLVFKALALAIGLVSAPVGVATVSAHTDFESSSPVDGEVVDDVVGTVILAFTSEATPVGEGFVALDSNLQRRTPDAVTTEDRRTFILSFDPPLGGGEVGVRWEVQAGDAHPIEGALSFTTPAAPPTTHPRTPDPQTPAPSPTGTDAHIAAETGAPATAAPASNAVAESAPSAPATAPDLSTPASTTPGSSSTTFDEFLAVDAKVSGEGIALTGRALGLVGVVLALGGLAFLALTFTGSRPEINFLVSAVRLLGVIVAVGALTEYVGLTMMTEGSLVTGWTTPTGLATTIRVLGGLAIAGSDRFSTTLVPPIRPPNALSAAVLEMPRTEQSVGRQRFRWHWRASGPALVGAAMLVVSFWFDGHTVTKGPRLLHAGVNSVHILAGGIWVGGVAAMAVVVWRRRRHGASSGAVELVVRFSSIASVALAAVAAAGLVMAFFVLDSIGDLMRTDWGQTLVIKTTGVALATALGAYNHFRLRPRLQATPDDDRLAAELRASLVVEAVVLFFVVTVTAWLVAAAT